MMLVFAGIAALLISVIPRADHPGAGSGTGVAVIAAGAVLAWAIDVDVPLILIVADVIAGAGAVNAQVGVNKRSATPFTNVNAL